MVSVWLIGVKLIKTGKLCHKKCPFPKRKIIKSVQPLYKMKEIKKKKKKKKKKICYLSVPILGIHFLLGVFIL